MNQLIQGNVTRHRNQAALLGKYLMRLTSSLYPSLALSHSDSYLNVHMLRCNGVGHGFE